MKAGPLEYMYEISFALAYRVVLNQYAFADTFKRKSATEVSDSDCDGEDLMDEVI